MRRIFLALLPSLWYGIYGQNCFPFPQWEGCRLPRFIFQEHMNGGRLRWIFA
jgi:hypothetical protein